VRRTTLFGRLQQFASRLYGPLVAAGMGAWQGPDGNFYGQSAAEHLGQTIWLQPQAQSRVTYVFPRVPADVTPARLILRENGAQTVVFELPR